MSAADSAAVNKLRKKEGSLKKKISTEMERMKMSFERRAEAAKARQEIAEMKAHNRPNQEKCKIL